MSVMNGIAFCKKIRSDNNSKAGIDNLIENL